MNKLTKYLLGVCLLAVSGFSAAYEIDTEKYFSYYKIPDSYRGGVSTFSPYVLLSKEKCQAKGIHASMNAMKGISLWVESGQTRHECWAELKNDIILVCPVGKTETEDVGNACTQISKSRFLSTESLPISPEF